ncbi:MAG: GntR family transcriptional regulator [Clostridiales bacterium]|nr:GntR family transcriptional regulator [Clostridiales bacterium]
MIIIDYKDKRSIFEQVTEKMKKLICSGALEPDSRLPSVRNMAVDLAINPNTIARSYHELESEGYIYTVKGKGCFAASAEDILKLKNDEYFKRLKQVISEGKGQGFSEEEIKGLFEKALNETGG